MATITNFRKLNIREEVTPEQLNRIQDNIAVTTDALINSTNPRWIDVKGTLANGWSILTYAGVAGSVDGGPKAVSYLKDSNGFVHLRGLVTGGTKASGATGTVFTLPVGYRPFYQGNFLTADATTTIIVVDNGDVRVAVSTNAYANLGGVYFLAEK